MAIRPADLDEFMRLSQKHAVESTVIGRYTDSGKLHISYAGKTCAHIDLDLLKSGFPQWEFEADWISPQQRGLFEPVIDSPQDYDMLLLDMLARPNICATEWIIRQYDHEVQGASVIKSLVGAERDVNSDASVIRPVLNSSKGLAFTQALLPAYSAIDAYHMTSCSIDEAVRRLKGEAGGEIPAVSRASRASDSAGVGTSMRSVISDNRSPFARAATRTRWGWT